MIPGRATAGGTRHFAERVAGRVHAEHFRLGLEGLTLSSIGLGTYLGEADEATDRLYVGAIRAAAERGCNVLDTAINYRYQLSERAIGTALGELEAAGVAREEILVCTKAGFIPLDAAVTRDINEYFRRVLQEPGVAEAGDVVAGCHIMTPRYLRNQAEQSLRNLDLQTIDVFYLHNPETQLDEIDRPEFERRIRAAFAELEALVREGKIGVYGTATWSGFRVPPDAAGHLSLPDLARLAEEAAGGESHFRAVQLPFNLGMTEALTALTQQKDGRAVSLLDAAGEFGISVFGSAALLQAQLLGRLPEELRAGFPGLKTDAQRALQFARSVPGIQTALVGMKTRAHVEENMAVAAQPPLGAAQFGELFGA